MSLLKWLFKKEYPKTLLLHSRNGAKLKTAWYERSVSCFHRLALICKKMILSMLLLLKNGTNKHPEYEGVNTVMKSKTLVKKSTQNQSKPTISSPLTANQISNNIV